jgi:hypothetical protein
LFFHSKEGEMSRFLGIIATAYCLLLFGLVVQAAGTPVPGVPEIDPGMASGAIGLLVCGLLTLTAKRKRKKDDR